MKKSQIILILFLLFILDIISKFFILNRLPPGGVYLFDGVGFELHKNYGMAFGISIYNILIIPISTIIIIFLLVALQEALRLKKYNLSFFIGLIVIGAISNLMNRIFYGYVIDFISIYFFPVFNFSDLYIVIGIIFCFLFLNKKPLDKNTKGLISH
ncbi:MAG: signal peptidase II [Patescibacteria group bacterium]|nr:signal peptidase II [Patescibacteria group bacterium]